MRYYKEAKEQVLRIAKEKGVTMSEAIAEIQQSLEKREEGE
jgi:hypothetical protein